MAAFACALVAPVAGLGPSALAAVPVGSADYGGYASGVAEYTNVLDTTAVAEVAKANVAVSSRQPIADTNNELNRQVVAGSNARAYSEGAGLTAELGGTPIELVAPSRAEAPPSTENIINNLLELPADPLARATAVQGEAQSLFDPSTCILGTDITRGAGFAANAQVLTATDGPSLVNTAASDPTRNVDQTTAHQLLVPQLDAQGQKLGNDFGFASEVRQTLAPVTIAGVGTIEIAGEWVLRVVATGIPGGKGAYFHYGPGDVSPSTPVLRIFDPENALIEEITLQEILGDTGLVIPIPGVAEVAVGEDPRAIATPGSSPDAESAPQIAADGTSVAAAVDVVRVRLLDGAGADIRIGHMEATAKVPPGGIQCPGLDVAKTVNLDPVHVGEPFVYKITVTNPYDCTLTNVKVVDKVTAPEGITFTIGDTSPPADTKTADTVTWNDIGPIPPHGSKVLGIMITVTGATRNGRMVDHARATADCAVGTGEAKTDVELTGEVTVEIPQVVADEPRTPDTTPRTGGLAATGLALAALGGFAGLEVLRRRARRRSII